MKHLTLSRLATGLFILGCITVPTVVTSAGLGAAPATTSAPKNPLGPAVLNMSLATESGMPILLSSQIDRNHRAVVLIIDAALPSAAKALASIGQQASDNPVPVWVVVAGSVAEFETLKSGYSKQSYLQWQRLVSREELHKAKLHGLPLLLAVELNQQVGFVYSGLAQPELYGKLIRSWLLAEPVPAGHSQAAGNTP